MLCPSASMFWLSWNLRHLDRPLDNVRCQDCHVVKRREVVQGRRGYSSWRRDTPKRLWISNSKILMCYWRAPRILSTRGKARLSDLCRNPPHSSGEEQKARPPRDLEQYHAYRLVSDRLKALFEAIDPEAFAFQDCNVRQRDGSIGPRFWL